MRSIERQLRLLKPLSAALHVLLASTAACALSGLLVPPADALPRAGNATAPFAFTAVAHQSWSTFPSALAMPDVAPGRIAASSGLEDLGEVPPDCGAVHKDFEDPSCLTQTRNGTFSLSPHVVHAGGTLTGTVSLGSCQIGGLIIEGSSNGPAKPCPIEWSQLAGSTGSVGAGKIVSGCTPTDTSCTVRISKSAETQKYTVITVGITSNQGTGISKDYYAVIGKGRFELAGHVKDDQYQPVPDVPIETNGPGGRRTRRTDSTGAYNIILKRGRYTVTAQGENMKPVKSKDCKPSGRSCSVYLIQDRTADFEVSTPPLIFSAKLGAEVHSTKHHSLIQAGTPFLIHVTLQNRDRERRIVVYPIYGELSGNASDGHLQPTGMPVRKITASGTEDEVKPSPYVLLAPKQTREFDVVVRTTASDARAETGVSEPGGTEATVKFTKPEAAFVDSEDKATKLDPAKDILMKKGSDEFRVGIDDSAPDTPPFSYLEATWYITKGLAIGLWNTTWGIARGLLWDLPKLAINAIASVPSASLAFVNYEAELWNEIKDDPAQVAAFINPLTNLTLAAAKEAPFLAEKAGDLYGKINQSIQAKYNTMWRDWYAGDWRDAMTAMTAEGTEQLANVALALAPGLLARMPAVAARWSAAKAALYARVSEELAPIIKPLTTATEALRALTTIIKPGFVLDDLALEKLYGVSAEQADWLRQFAKARRLLITFRSRAQASLKWLAEGAMLKPAWIKMKTVNFYDAKYLGYEESDIGRLILRKPPTREQFYKDIYPKVPPSERPLVAKRWLDRRTEWETNDPGYGRQMYKWNADQKVTGKWPWQENGIDPAVQADEFTTTGFRLTRRPSRPGEYVVEVENPATKQFVSVTGDVDFLAITKANGKPLTDAEHVQVLKDIREGPVGAMHPETATWDAPLSAKEKYLSNNGQCCAAQVGADGNVRAVQYDRNLSFFDSPQKYRVWWEGGYLLP